MTLGTIIRLSLINSIGFLVSTLIAIWVGGIAPYFGMPAWFAGLAAFTQIGGAALFNILTPYLFGRYPILPLARIALAVAAAGFFIATIHNVTLFSAGCLLSGCAIGVVLNVVNRMMGSSEHVQSNYSTLVLVQIGFGAASFLASAALVSYFGFHALFAYSGSAALFGLLLLIGVTFEVREESGIAATVSPTTNRPAALLALFSLGFFFLGLAPISAFMPAVGQAAGLSVDRAYQIIGLGLPFSLLGAVLAKVLGERISPLVAIVSSTLLLAVSCLAVTLHPTFALFTMGVFMTVAPAMFSTPYFFAQLGGLDQNGRYAAQGPAVMLIGLATGPSVAVILNAQYGLPAIGIFSFLLLLLSAAAFSASTLAKSQRQNAVSAA